jgi:dTDP-4-dehydrorhamnose reductase
MSEAAILVFGKSGQVARELARAPWPANLAPQFLSRDDADVTDRARVRAAVARVKPRVVVNAAGYTSVDAAEAGRAAAFAVNRDGAAHIAEACAEFEIPLLHISTDYVFDGAKRGAYREDDPVAPVNAYGESKAAGEAALRALLARHLILRTSWVYSPFGQNFVRTMLRLAEERAEVRVVADQHGSPTAAAEIAAAIVRLVPRLAGRAETPYFGTFHYCGGGITSWHDFAQAIFAQLAQHGRKVPRLVAIGTKDYPTPARRPANSALDCARIAAIHGVTQHPWQESLRSCLAELAGF